MQRVLFKTQCNWFRGSEVFRSMIKWLACTTFLPAFFICHLIELQSRCCQEKDCNWLTFLYRCLPCARYLWVSGNTSNCKLFKASYYCCTLHVFPLKYYIEKCEPQMKIISCFIFGMTKYMILKDHLESLFWLIIYS